MALLCGLTLGLCGCSLTQDKAGSDLIKAARKDYTSLDSAKVIMTNESTGEVEQTFTFKYDEKDVLMFSYYGKSDSSEYAQFNNGAECFTYDNGEFTYSSRGDKDFSQYTRALPHPQADAGLLLYSPDSITEDKVTEEDGGTHVHYEYDVNKIGARTEDGGEVTDFATDYYFDQNGGLIYFTETTQAKENGEDKTYEYKVEITEKNSVNKVENTTEQFKQ